MGKRFSKDAMLEFLTARANRLQSQYGFTTQSGYAQVLSRGEQVNRAYGEWATCRNLIDSIVSGYIQK